MPDPKTDRSNASRDPVRNRAMDIHFLQEIEVPQTVDTNSIQIFPSRDSQPVCERSNLEAKDRFLSVLKLRRRFSNRSSDRPDRAVQPVRNRGRDLSFFYRKQVPPAAAQHLFPAR